MLKKANQQSMRQQLATAASVRGGANVALVTRNAQNNMAQSSVENAQNAAILRAQEQQSAEGELGKVLGTIRGQDTQEGQFNAQMGLEYDKFVSGRKLALMGLGLDAGKALAQAQSEAADRGLRAGMFNAQFGLDTEKFAEEKRQFDINMDYANRQLSQAKSQADRQFWTTIITGLMSAGGAVLGGYLGGPAGAMGGAGAGASAGSAIVGSI
jgi:hypothetical protein